MSVVALYPSDVAGARSGIIAPAAGPIEHEPKPTPGLAEIARTARHSVEIKPAEIVRRRSVLWDGMWAEIVQIRRLERFAVRFQAPVHLLAIYGRGMRQDGETQVHGVPSSTLKNLRRKFTFVPAGCELREWQEPRVLAQITYLYIEPDELPGFIVSGNARVSITPRLLFEDGMQAQDAY